MRLPRTRSGFTLIELLTVIAIIAILIALIMPTVGSTNRVAQKAQATNDLKQLVTAVKSFQTDYGYYPIDPAIEAQTPHDIEYGAPGTSFHNQEIVNVLRADTLPTDTLSASGTSPISINSRAVIYLDMPLVRDSTNPKNGLGTGHETNGITTKTGEWYDPWGRPYIIDIDANYDGYVQPPGSLLLQYKDVNYVTWQGAPAVQAGVIAGSFGADHTQGSAATPKYFKNSDDVLSWQ